MVKGSAFLNRWHHLMWLVAWLVCKLFFMNLAWLMVRWTMLWICWSKTQRSSWCVRAIKFPGIWHNQLGWPSFSRLAWSCWPVHQILWSSFFTQCRSFLYSGNLVDFDQLHWTKNRRSRPNQRMRKLIGRDLLKVVPPAFDGLLTAIDPLPVFVMDILSLMIARLHEAM